MGALVPFPKRWAQGQAPSVRVPSEGSAKVIILPVVQMVRPGVDGLAPATQEPC
ncbi:hypothetical protein KHC23_02390 [Ancylobacter dichloromethanicus]|uniref:Uncharacterized protein n=1 Tax=Ancylobacter dichloromethanicus TaxID=518825 RepID=A0A9W6JB54_9HYPH|nr:hypothetical protein [Ancylobacter dichloromethanicus]MBS7552509.1 hypothetical protein [Ancylobacter dichloromethanicus]GLK74251.1 hypothetical protein GCM10017643_43690 [Ancylobacter dichloromethanicus]